MGGGENETLWVAQGNRFGCTLMRMPLLGIRLAVVITGSPRRETNRNILDSHLLPPSRHSDCFRKSEKAVKTAIFHNYLTSS